MLSFEEKSQIKDTLRAESVSIWDSNPHQIPRYRIGDKSIYNMPVFMFGEEIYLGTKRYTKGKAKKFDLIVFCHEEHIRIISFNAREHYCRMLKELALMKFKQYIYDNFPRSDLGEPISIFGSEIHDGKFITELGYAGKRRKYSFKLPFDGKGISMEKVNRLCL